MLRTLNELRGLGQRPEIGRTLRLDSKVSDPKLREGDVTLDLALAISLKSFEVGGIRQLNAPAGNVQPKIGRSGVQQDGKVCKTHMSYLYSRKQRL